MFCIKCGQELRDGARFCPSCGAAVEEHPAGKTSFASKPARSYDPEERILGGGKRRRGLGLAAVLAVIVILCAALAVSAVGGLFSSPSSTVGKAVAKSLKAHADVAEGLLNFRKPLQDHAVSQTFSLELKNCADSQLRVLAGGSVELSTGFSLKNRAMDAAASVRYGSVDVIAAQMDLADDVLTVYVPDLMDGTAVSLSTETLSEDLNRLGAEIDENIGFNLFTLLESFQAAGEAKTDAGAWKELKKAIEVKKDGKSSIEVNGKRLDCTVYHAVIPKDAMRNCVNALEDAYEAKLENIFLAVLRQTGAPEALLNDLNDSCKSQRLDDAFFKNLADAGYSDSLINDLKLACELRETLDTAELFDALRQAIRELGDLELDVYLNNGCVSAVEWEGRVNGAKLEAGLYLGGGGNYADDLSFELSGDGAKLRLESSGNHSVKNGFTDETSLRLQENGRTLFSLRSELEYQPQRSSDNFSWTIKGDEFSLSAEGTVAAGKNSLEVALEDVDVDVYGTEVVSLELGWSIGPYSKAAVDAKKTLAVSEMSRSDIDGLAADIQGNAEIWLRSLASAIPELGYLAYFL